MLVGRASASTGRAYPLRQARLRPPGEARAARLQGPRYRDASGTSSLPGRGPSTRGGLALLRRGPRGGAGDRRPPVRVLRTRNSVSALLARGDPLGEVQRDAGGALEFVRKARFGLIVDILPDSSGSSGASGASCAEFSSGDAPRSRGLGSSSTWRAIRAWRSPPALLDPQAAGALPPGRPRGRSPRRSRRRPPLDVDGLVGWPSTILLRARAGGELRRGARREREEPPATRSARDELHRGVGRDLPGELREPRGAGRRRDRSHRRERLDAERLYEEAIRSARTTASSRTRRSPTSSPLASTGREGSS